jgi:hypothetical protein
LHVDARWYSRGHDLSRITLSDSHVPDVGEHGERIQAMFVKAPDLVGVCANRIGKDETSHDNHQVLAVTNARVKQIPPQHRMMLDRSEGHAVVKTPLYLKPIGRAPIPESFPVAGPASVSGNE